MALPKSIQLGFAEEVEDWDIFPSKVGGKPVWLIPVDFPSALSVLCARCGCVMSFLMQIYAPLTINPSTYHRIIYVFCCRTFDCVKNCPLGSFKVFRAQLPKQNPYYSIKSQKDTVTGEEEYYPNFPTPQLCRVSGLYGKFKCSGCQYVYYAGKQFQREDWHLRHKQECPLMKQAKSQCNQIDDIAQRLQKMEISQNSVTCKGIFLEFEITTEPAKTSTQSNPPEDAEKAEDMDSDDDDDKETDTQIIENNRKMIEHYTARTECYDNAEFQSEDWNVSQKDPFFQNFLRVVSEEPEQILRYYEDNNTEPIWVSSHHRPKPIEQYIKKCSCGSDRVCEFQIMPQLLYLLKVDEDENPIDWGTLVVFTCKNSCSTANYVEEFLWPQQIPVKE